MTLEIVEAGDELMPVVLNLGLYYIYDFTEFLGFRCPNSGLYYTRHWEKYWTEPERWPFLVRYQGEPAGFVLVSTEGTQPETQFTIDDFFIMRKFRRQGLGSRVAADIFNRFYGRWEVSQVVENEPAHHFWHKVIDRYTSGKYHELPEPVMHGQWLAYVQVFDNLERV